MPSAAEAGNTAMPTRGQHEPRDHDRQAPPPAARARSESDAGQRHEQQQEHVVDRHHRADEGAPVAQRVAHENRDECGEQRAGDTGKEAAEPDEQGRRDTGGVMGAARPTPDSPGGPRQQRVWRDDGGAAARRFNTGNPLPAPTKVERRNPVPKGEQVRDHIGRRTASVGIEGDLSAAWCMPFAVRVGPLG